MSDPKPLSVHSFPQAIVHIDGDSFFAACEQATNPEYKGKPVVVGAERGIATAMSQAAKELGIERGDRIHKIKQEHPQVIVAASDYETYSLFSVRFFDVVRRHTPEVEEYSVDECFADITGLRAAANASYEEIAQEIKADLQTDLGLTFSVGLAPSKTVAKIATDWRKPDGFTAIKAKHIHHALKNLRPADIWGIGSSTAARLKKLGVTTALEFARQDRSWVESNFHKPQLEIWQELRGRSVKKVTTEKSQPKSISKTKTFTPPSADRSYVFSQLAKNVENACIKARRHDVYTDKITVFLKTQDFHTAGRTLQLSLSANTPKEILPAARKGFAAVFSANTQYRATGIRLKNLVHKRAYQRDLFNQSAEISRSSKVFSVVDAIDDRYGKHSVCLASSLPAINKGNHRGERQQKPRRQQTKLAGETDRQRLDIPYLGLVS